MAASRSVQQTQTILSKGVDTWWSCVTRGPIVEIFGSGFTAVFFVSVDKIAQPGLFTPPPVPDPMVLPGVKSAVDFAAGSSLTRLLKVFSVWKSTF